MNFLTVQAESLGAELVSVVDGPRRRDAVARRPKCLAPAEPILFPYCGKLRGGRYTLDGAGIPSAPARHCAGLRARIFGRVRQRDALCLRSGAGTLERFPANLS